MLAQLLYFIFLNCGRLRNLGKSKSFTNLNLAAIKGDDSPNRNHHLWGFGRSEAVIIFPETSCSTKKGQLDHHRLPTGRRWMPLPRPWPGVGAREIVELTTGEIGRTDFEWIFKGF